MLGLFRRKGATTYPGPVALDTRRLPRIHIDDVAVEVSDITALCMPETARIAYLQLGPQRNVVVHPLFWCGDGNRAVFDFKTKLAPPARLYRFTGATEIFGKGLLAHEGCFVALDRFKFQELGRPDYPHNAPYLTIDGDAVELTRAVGCRDIEGPCLLLSAGGEEVWGHWLVDMLPRLGLAGALPVPFRVIVGSDAPAWTGPLLERFGVGPDRILRQSVGREVLRARDLYVPSYLRYANALSTLANSAWARLGSERPGRTRRLYVSRRRLAAGSTIANVEEVESLAARRGYAIVHPERLTLSEQSALFAGATHVMGESGSGLHDTVLSPAGTRVAVLLSPAIEGFVQAGIGHVRAQPTGFAFGLAREGDRAFEMPIAQVREVLDRLEVR